MKSVCVFCGANRGSNPAYTQSARNLGIELARQGLTLVYGGGNVGLMGELADATLESGGRVIGVIPEALVAKEVAHKGLSELIVVESMHKRKATMADLADAFIALPGGFGTFEEFFEVLTWSQLGFHKKPCGLLNSEGFYDPLIALVSHATEHGFVPNEHANLILKATEPKDLLALLLTWRPHAFDKWISRSER